MKTIRFVGYLFYRYYSKGSLSNIPYFSTLCALSILVYIHLVELLILFNMMHIIPTNGKQNNIGNFFKMGLFLAPLFFLLAIIVKKSDILNMSYPDSMIKRGNKYLVIYICASYALLIFLIYLKKVDRL